MQSRVAIEKSRRYSVCIGMIFDLPSLESIDLKNVFWQEGGPIARGSDTRPRRSLPS
jgi:hypothetical protein